MTMKKPRVRPSSTGYGFMCTGHRLDGVYAFGWGSSIEGAYNDWLVFDEADIPF